jgi:hypothetical protein
MNWRLEAGALDGSEGSFLQREITRGVVAPRSGPGVAASATLSYADSEPAYAGATLRLTRWYAAPQPTELPAVAEIAFETYESLLRARSAEVHAGAASTRAGD